MNSRFSKLKSHFANWREWEMNPIVIKELRQGVRSWTVVGMLLLFLTVLFVTSLGFLITESFDVNADIGLGGQMFSSFVVILAGASIFFIPLFIGVRVAQERQDNNPDLLYVSTLSPAQIIRGKFLCGAYTALLFFSACMPFMAFTNLLRGVDLPTVFFIMAFLFLVVCAANMFAIFLACLPMSRPFKFLFLIYGIFQSVGIMSSLVGTSFLMMRSGVGEMMSDPDFWINVVTVVGIGAAVIGLFYVLSVALISPPSSNRALPVRKYITIMWLLGGILSFIWVARTGEAEWMYAWQYPTFVLMMFALLVIISNSDQLSLRVRRTIPQSGFRRALAFFFFNGAAGGLMWVVGILLATFFLTGQITAAFARSSGSSEATGWIGTTTAYAFDYALAGLFIHRRFLSRRPPKLAGLLAVLLAAAWAIVPGIVLFFMNELSWNAVGAMQPGNVFNIFSLRDDSDLKMQLYFARIWLALMLALNAKWFFQQMKNFRPPPSSAPPVLP